MPPNVRRLILWGAVLATLAFILLLLNQVLQLAEAAARIQPYLGQAVFWAGLALLLACLAVPVVLLLRLPRALVPPEDEEGPEFERHLRLLSRRLAGNPLLQGRTLRERREIEEALAVLDARATEAIRQAASRAFVTTAISQNGSLDALAVLGIQARMIWDVAKVYEQRPTIADTMQLYANVLATAFVAGQIDDADLSEVIQPLMSTAVGSAAGVIPGFQVASSVFVNSVLAGTANAFLTLRVGVIAQEYKRALVRPSRGGLRRMAFTRAAGMLSSIAVDGAADVASAIGRASKLAMSETLRAGGQAVTSAARTSGEAITSAARTGGETVSEAVGGVGKRVRSAGDAVRERLPFKKRAPDSESEPQGPEQDPG